MSSFVCFSAPDPRDTCVYRLHMWRNGNTIACGVEFGERRCADVDILLTSSMQDANNGEESQATGTYCNSRNHFRLPTDVRDDNMKRYRRRKLMNTFKSVDRDLLTKNKLLNGYDDRLESDRNADVSYYVPVDDSKTSSQNKVEFLTRKVKDDDGIHDTDDVKQTVVGYCTRGNFDITGYIRLDSDEMDRERTTAEEIAKELNNNDYDADREKIILDEITPDLQITCRAQQRRMNEDVTIADQIITKTMTVRQKDIQNVTCIMPPRTIDPY